MEKREIASLLATMEPKIKRSLSNTTYQEQEDLKQEIFLKMIETIVTKEFIEGIGFWEFKKMHELNT